MKNMPNNLVEWRLLSKLVSSKGYFSDSNSKTEIYSWNNLYQLRIIWIDFDLQLRNSFGLVRDFGLAEFLSDYIVKARFNFFS